MGFRITVDVVREEDGVPIAGALVQLDVADPSKRMSAATAVVRTDANGRAVIEEALPPGAAAYGVLFARATGRGANPDAFAIPLDLAKNEHHRVIRLPPGRTYSGVVRDVDGRPIEGAIAHATAVEQGGCSSARRGQGLRMGGPYPVFPYTIRDDNKTNPDGRFELLDIVEVSKTFANRHTTVLTIDHEDYVTRHQTGLERWLAGVSGEVQLEIVLERGTSIGGRVTTGAGHSIEGAEIRARGRAESNPNPCGGSEKESRSDRDGRFVIDGLAAGVHRVEIVAAGFTAREIELDPVASDSRSLEIQLVRGSELEGTVLDSKGASAAHAYLSLWGRDDSRIAGSRADGSGRFRFGGLPLDLMEAIVYVGVHSFAVTLPAHELVLRLGPGVPVEIVVKDRATGEAVRAREARDGRGFGWGNLTQGGSSRMLRFDGDGRAKSALSPVGKATIQVHVLGFRVGTKTIDAEGVEPGSVIELSIERGISVRGELVGADGAPVTEVLVTFQNQEAWASYPTAFSDDAGRFQIEGAHTDGVLVLEHPEHALAVCTMEGAKARPDGTAQFRLRLARGATIAGTVRRADGRSATGEIVKLEWPEGETSVTLPWGLVQPNGSYRIEHVPAYQLVLRLRGEIRSVALRDGETLGADFVLPA